MKKIIDLTASYGPDIPGFQRKQVKTVNKDGWNASELHIYSHAGTHMDAPVHFDVSDITIDRIPLDACLIDCLILDVKDVQPGCIIPAGIMNDLPGAELKGKGIILRTGWSKYIGKQELFRNKLPRISIPLAERMVSLGIRLLGVEPPSVADVNDREEVTRIHTILLEAGIVIVEGLINLERIEKSWVWLIALPLKIKDGDGAPARVIALYDS